MAILRTNFFGDPNIGLYGFATDMYCLMGLRQKANKKAKSVFNVPLRVSTAMDTGFVSLFVAGNSSGLIVPRISEGYELNSLKKSFDVLVIDTDYTAIGNLVLLNDKGIILSPLLRKHKGAIKKFFGLPCEISKIAGTAVVGSAAIATNNGCLLHPKVRASEKRLIESTLQVRADIGTVNFGSPFVKSGIIANANGLIVSDACSGPELGRINEALGFL